MEMKLKDLGRYPAPRDLPDSRLRKKSTDPGEPHRTSDVTYKKPTKSCRIP